MEKGGRAAILGAIVLLVVVWQLPYGRLALYPLSLLATYVHEMGHGLTALLVGAHFDRLVMFADGSGFAEWRGDVGRLARGAIAAGGLLGPSILGGAVVASSRVPKLSRALLFGSAGILALTAVLFAGSVFTIAFVVGWAILLGSAARFLSPRLALFFTQLLGATLCLSIFQDLSYMFSDGAVVGGVARRSDSAAIADALFLPYWFWGAMVAAAALSALGLGLAAAFRAPRI
ncbi:MAG: M50 family metallopeptidase [Myxococcota bacterium]